MANLKFQSTSSQQRASPHDALIPLPILFLKTLSGHCRSQVALPRACDNLSLVIQFQLFYLAQPMQVSHHFAQVHLSVHFVESLKGLAACLTVAFEYFDCV